MGITTATLATAKRRGLVPATVTVDTLTTEQAKRIYFDLYWLPPFCPEFPAPLDLLLFDAYVNHRPGSAVRLIQLAVDAVPDGIVGTETLRKANAIGLDMAKAIERYAGARQALFLCIADDDPSQRVFLRGWMSRVRSLCATAAAELVAA